MEKKSTVRQDFLNGMTERERERYFTRRKSAEKVNVLATDILTECQRQDLTIEEFEMLARSITTKYESMLKKCKTAAKVSQYSSNVQNESHQEL